MTVGQRDNSGTPLWSAMINARSGGAVRPIDQNDDWDAGKARPEGPGMLQRLVSWVQRR